MHGMGLRHETVALPWDELFVEMTGGQMILLLLWMSNCPLGQWPLGDIEPYYCSCWILHLHESEVRW